MVISLSCAYHYYDFLGINDDASDKRLYAGDLTADNYASDGAVFYDQYDDDDDDHDAVGRIAIGTEADTARLREPGQFVAYRRDSLSQDYRYSTIPIKLIDTHAMKSV